MTIYSKDCKLNRSGECIPHGGFDHKPLAELQQECKLALSREGWLERAAEKQALQQKLAKYLADQPWHVLADLVQKI